MELKITKEKVLEAATANPEAAATLKTLFPDVFENDNIAFPKGLLAIADRSLEDFSRRALGRSTSLQVLTVAASEDKYYGRGLYLEGRYRAEVMPSKNDGTQIIFFKK